MKDIFILITIGFLTLALVAGAVYAGVVFVVLEPNPTNWGAGIRLFALLGTVIILSLVIFAIREKQ